MRRPLGALRRPTAPKVLTIRDRQRSDNNSVLTAKGALNTSLMSDDFPTPDYNSNLKTQRYKVRLGETYSANQKDPKPIFRMLVAIVKLPCTAPCEIPGTILSYLASCWYKEIVRGRVIGHDFSTFPNRRRWLIEYYIAQEPGHRFREGYHSQYIFIKCHTQKGQREKGPIS